MSCTRNSPVRQSTSMKLYEIAPRPRRLSTRSTTLARLARCEAFLTATRRATPQLPHPSPLRLQIGVLTPGRRLKRAQRDVVSHRELRSWRLNTVRSPWAQATRPELMNLEAVTTILILLGLLSACTTAAWGSLSDRLGRKPSLMATMVADFVAASSLLLFAYTLKKWFETLWANTNPRRVMKVPARAGFLTLACGYAIGGLLGGPM